MSDSKNKSTKGEKITAIVSAVAAIGLLLRYLFIDESQIQGFTFWHITNMILILTVTVSACLMAFFASRKKKNNKQ